MRKNNTLGIFLTIIASLFAVFGEHLMKISYKKGDFLNAEKFTKKVISFPHHQHLKKKEIEFICKKINDFYS